MGDAHNIFISWSRPQAKAAALALRDWLPRVIQASRPWMSETDIEKGKPWLDELMGALGGVKLGIVCLTPECLSEPWVLFEVGVVYKALPESRIWTYLLDGLRHSDVPNPLGIFQHTVASKEETFRLLRSVNQAMGERAISDEILKDEFERRWKELDEKLRALPVPSKPVHTTRTNEEMFREIVEAVRAGAADAGWSKDALVTLLKGMNRLIGQAGLGVPQSDTGAAEGSSYGRRGLYEALLRTGPDTAEWSPLVEEARQRVESGLSASMDEGLRGTRRMHAPGKRGRVQRKTGDEKK